MFDWIFEYVSIRDKDLSIITFSFKKRNLELQINNKFDLIISILDF